MLLERKQLEELEEKNLAFFALKNSQTKGRQFDEPQDPYRLDFQRDRDRVIHAQAFRRLKDKTQVFIPRYGDHYRNRLTHTLEVAQLSGDLARNFLLNEDLAETIALAHDLGHTPFGHAGEDRLHQLMEKYGSHYEHNQQSKRIVEKLETPYSQFRGLNLTWEVLEGLDKHQSEYDQKDISFQQNLSLEAQIVNLADEIAYQNHDTEDGLLSGILEMDDMKSLEIWKRALESVPKEANFKLQVRLGVNNLIKLMVQDVYKQSEKNLKANNIQSVQDVYECDQQTLIDYSDEMKKMNKELKKYLYEKMYFHPKVRIQSERGQNILEFLFEQYMKKPPEPVLEMQEIFDEPLHVLVKDYVAGMTDAYAEKQFYGAETTERL